MHFIFGGKYMGKLDFARKIYGSEMRICDLKTETIESMYNSDIVTNLQEGIKKLLLQKLSPLEYFNSNINKLGSKVLIGDEIGSGIVPNDKFERTWRDETGRVYQYISSYSESVDRVWCGINHRLK